MTISHVPTAATLRADYAHAELQAEALRAEVAKAQREVDEVKRSGSAVLAALEAAMIPLMAELAVTRHACKEYCSSIGEPFILAPVPAPEGSSQSGVDAMEAEVGHLQVEIAHYRKQTERLQVEERQRSHEISRLCGEYSEAYDHLNYEQQCVKHHEECKQVGIDAGGGWAGMGPCGLGRRTQEVRAEKKLREFAEQRGGRLARDVTKLSSDTSQQQASIAQLGRRLKNVRKALSERDSRLAHTGKHTKLLHAKLKVTEDATSGNGGEGVAFESTQDDPVAPSLRPSKKKGGSAASTGRLPQLSF
jgi:hypothetical protein